MSGLRVLVVDDSLTIRAMMEELLNAQPDCTVVGMAAGVPEALAMLWDKAPTVITLDLLMPGQDGSALLDAVRGRPHAPIVILSSSIRDGDEASEALIAQGAEACFDKTRVIPDLKRFVSTLRKVVDRRAAATAG